MDRLTDAVGGLQAEVRDITTHLKKANKANARRSSRSPRRSARKSGPSQPNAPEDVVDDYEADLDEPEKLTNPTKHRSTEQNDLAVSASDLYLSEFIPLHITAHSRLMWHPTCCYFYVGRTSTPPSRKPPLPVRSWYGDTVHQMVPAAPPRTSRSISTAPPHPRGMIQRARCSLRTSSRSTTISVAIARRSRLCSGLTSAHCKVITRSTVYNPMTMMRNLARRGTLRVDRRLEQVPSQLLRGRRTAYGSRVAPRPRRPGLRPTRSTIGTSGSTQYVHTTELGSIQR